jgi:hypothetical protein
MVYDLANRGFNEKNKEICKILSGGSGDPLSVLHGIVN